tara:strand:- start:553 stop:813 length:261 start_codon:yes stop_codon:yes gene_type:complete
LLWIGNDLEKTLICPPIGGLFFTSMNKWQSKDLPIPITILALLVSNASDKIEELTSIPSMIVHYIALGLMLIPLYIWISGWLKNRK